MGERRDELTDKIVAYLVRHGVAGLSLRPLAAHVGTSARLLIFHYGTREGLIEAAMDEVRRRIQGSFAKKIAAAKGRTSAVATFWEWTIHPDNLAYLRLLFEVQILALQDPKHYAQYLRRTSTSWLDIIESSFGPGKDNRALATLCVAVVDGLLLEYMATGEAQRTTKALRLFEDIVAKHHARGKGAARR